MWGGGGGDRCCVFFLREGQRRKVPEPPRCEQFVSHHMSVKILVGLLQFYSITVGNLILSYTEIKLLEMKSFLSYSYISYSKVGSCYDLSDYLPSRTKEREGSEWSYSMNRSLWC